MTNSMLDVAYNGGHRKAVALDLHIIYTVSDLGQ